MPELILMERGAELMHVPPDKVATYLAAGWKEISRGPMSTDSAVPVEAATLAEEAPQKDTPELVETARPKQVRTKHRSGQS